MTLIQLDRASSARDKTVSEQNHYGAHDRPDKACPFAGSIPAESLPEERGNKRADDSENGREDKA